MLQDLIFCPRDSQIYTEYQRALLMALEGCTSVEERTKAKEEVLEHFRGILGGRTSCLVTGSAPTSEAVKDFLRECFRVPVIDGYGSTEAGGISSDNIVDPNVDVKLIDRPELGYTNSDQPYPRGEIAVRTNTMLTGYYKNPEATKKVGSYLRGSYSCGFTVSHHRVHMDRH